MGEFGGGVGVRVWHMRHVGKWDGMVLVTAGHGHGNLLVLLVACRGLGACQLSVLIRRVAH